MKNRSEITEATWQNQVTWKTTKFFKIFKVKNHKSLLEMSFQRVMKVFQLFLSRIWTRAY